MKKVKRTITMMELRSQPGEVIRAVEVDKRTIWITKQGRVVAKITPAVDHDGTTTIHPDGTISGAIPLTFRRNLGGSY